MRAVRPPMGTRPWRRRGPRPGDRDWRRGFKGLGRCLRPARNPRYAKPSTRLTEAWRTRPLRARAPR